MPFFNKNIGVKEILIIIAVGIICMFSLYHGEKRKLSQFEKEIAYGIKQVESFGISFGIDPSKKYKLVTYDVYFTNLLRILCIKEPSDFKSKQKKLYYYSFFFKIEYQNGKKAELHFLRDFEDDYYFFSYSSDSVKGFFPLTFKDENGDFQKMIDYIVEHGEEVEK